MKENEYDLEENAAPSEVAQEDDAKTEDEDEGNLALKMGKRKKGREFLKKLGARVDEDFRRDWDSNEAHRARRNEILALFRGDLKTLSLPYKGAANRHVPVLFENTLRWVGRIGAEVFKDRRYIMTVVANSPEKRERAAQMTLYDNWQFREGIRNFYREQDRLLMNFGLFGDATAHSYYDNETRSNAHDTLSADDFVVPYTHTSTMPDYSDCPRVTKVMRLPRHKLESYQDTWLDVQEVLEGEDDEGEDRGDPEDEQAQAAAQRLGIEKPDKEPTGVYKLYQQETWVRLPKEKRERFCRIVVDSKTKRVLELRVLEEVPSEEKLRVSRQTQELAVYNAQLATYESEVRAIAENKASAFEMGAAQGLDLAALSAELDQVVLPPPPVRPSWMTETQTEPAPARKRPVHMFTHVVDIENLSGCIGLGRGAMLADFNMLANDSVSAFEHSATLANAGGWLIDKMVQFDDEDADEVDFTPGKFTRLSGMSVDDLRKHMIDLRPGPANPQLLELASLAQKWGQASMQSPDVLGGAPGKSGETARGFQGRVEQATAMLSSPAQKYVWCGLDNIIRNNARLNATYLDETHAALLLDWRTNETVTATVRREWYDEPYHYNWRTDLRFATEAQRRAEADELVALPRAVPALMQSPLFIYETTKAALEVRGQSALVPSLGPPPPPPQVPLGTPPATPPQQAAPQGARPAAPPKPRGT